MSQISVAQVEEAKKALSDAQASLPASGSLSKKADMLLSIIEILKECWNTTSGNKEQEKLQQIINSNLNMKSVESTIENAKSGQVSATTIEKSEIIFRPVI